MTLEKANDIGYSPIQVHPQSDKILTSATLHTSEPFSSLSQTESSYVQQTQHRGQDTPNITSNTVLATSETETSAPFKTLSPEQQALWDTIQGDLRQRLNQPSFQTWIAPLRLGEVSETRVTLYANSEFNRDWILKKYRPLLTEVIAQRLGQLVEVQILVDEQLPDLEPLLDPAFGDDAPDLAQALPPSPQPARQRMWTPKSQFGNLNPRYTFENFIVGEHNRFCHAAALAVAETPAQSYNPFFIYGGVGLGKTHLMQAIAHFVIQHQPESVVRYVTAEQFTNDLIGGLTSKTMKTFRDKYRKNDVLIIDDVQFLEGKERTQEEVFHTFNALHEAGKQIILSSDRSPRYLTQLEDRLRSRFEWGLIADIQPADYETRLAILHGKVTREHLSVPEEVLAFIAESHPNNIRELEGALNKVAAYALLTRTILDLDMAKSVLGLQTDTTRLSLDKILETVAAYYHLRASDLKSPIRAKDVSHARQVAIYILRTLTEASFPKIGELLGGRKHTTILYAYEKIKEDLNTHPGLSQQIKDLTGRLQSV